MTMVKARGIAICLTVTSGLALLAAGCSEPVATSSPTYAPTPTLEPAPTATPQATVRTLDPLPAGWSTPTPIPTATPFPLSDTGRVTRDELVARLQTAVVRDGIPAILAPHFVPPEAVPQEFRDVELVMGMSINGESKAYPIDILSHHEIVNDVVGGVPVVVTW